MHPGIIAAAKPEKIAYTMADTGTTVTFGELEVQILGHRRIGRRQVEGVGVPVEDSVTGYFGEEAWPRVVFVDAPAGIVRRSHEQLLPIAQLPETC